MPFQGTHFDEFQKKESQRGAEERKAEAKQESQLETEEREAEAKEGYEKEVSRF